MLFENRHNQRYQAERLNGWLGQIAGLLTGMASSCFVGALVIPFLTGDWPSSPGLWVVAGVVLFLAAVLTVNLISVENEEWTTGG